MYGFIITVIENKIFNKPNLIHALERTQSDFVQIREIRHLCMLVFY